MIGLGVAHSRQRSAPNRSFGALAGFAIINLPIYFLLGWIVDFVDKPSLVTICLFLGVVAVLPMLWSDSRLGAKCKLIPNCSAQCKNL